MLLNIEGNISWIFRTKTQEVLLKIRDKSGEGVKGTQIKTGSVCGNEGMKKGKIVSFLNLVEGTNDSDSKPEQT